MKFQTNTTNETGGHGVTSPEILLKRKLAGYLAGVAGTAAMLGTQQAEAAVVYFDPIDVVAPGTGGGIKFDMVSGVATTAANPTDTGPTAFAIWNYNRSVYLDYLQLKSSVDLNNPTVGGDKISKLALGATIGSGSAFGGSTTTFFDVDGTSGYPNYLPVPNFSYPWATEVDGTTGYVGLRFNIGGPAGSTHYGWARFTYNDLTTGNLTLHDFAYENAAGLSILAGDTGSASVPEPSRALLALAGLCGVALRRRRKQAA